uniref:NADH-ubiquinone oxidoreductase chain 4L n=1 Tax=Spirocodon saltatrix TaxID=6093 RepID=A0A7D5SDN7_9CNID|nr:NADH dehydrogenase subunit 4L [Spirocodon saltatrix]QLH56861.1 NADH dehydrogenase subunit 4L [Spirocodon saltatrix]
MFELTLFPLIIFSLSLIGIIINRTNIILLLVCIEIMLLSMTSNFLINGFLLDSIASQIGAIYIITIAAVESAIGLSIMIVFYKIKGSLSIRFLNLLKG